VAQRPYLTGQLKPARPGLIGEDERLMFRAAEPKYRQTPTFNPNDSHNLEVSKRLMELNKFQRAVKNEPLFRAVTEKNFAQLAYAHIERRDYDKDEFYERTLLSGKTYDRVKANTFPHPKIETVMSVCIGLELGVFYGIPVLTAAGHTLTNSPLHCAYHQLLATCCGKTIFECNEMLEKSGFEPLNKRE
jgi:hypothetical protein